MGALTLSSSAAHAQEVGSLSYYAISEAEYRAHYHEWQVFLEYNLHREQCQHYQAPPAGYVMNGCNVYRVASDQPAAMAEPRAETVTETVTKPAPPAPIAQQASATSYTLHFGFGKSNIANSEEAILDRAAEDIKKYSPAAVTVSGYASTPGSDDYNQVLSEKRAQAVAQALSREGVDPEIIHQRAYGETHLAVPTANGLRMPANRRVVIEFNR
jgi:outer membrane protein OmpA-like peptidoglycan-associated protein